MAQMPDEVSFQVVAEVVTLRDLFALAALPGVVFAHGASAHGKVAKLAYGLADAMLKERGQ